MATSKNPLNLARPLVPPAARGPSIRGIREAFGGVSLARTEHKAAEQETPGLGRHSFELAIFGH